MDKSTEGQGHTFFRIGVGVLVIGIGLTLMPFYHTSKYVHFLFGLCFGISLPILIVWLFRIKRDRAS